MTNTATLAALLRLVKPWSASAMPMLGTVHMTPEEVTATDLYTTIRWRPAGGTILRTGNTVCVATDWLRPYVELAAKEGRPCALAVEGVTQLRLDLGTARPFHGHGYPGGEFPGKIPTVPADAEGVDLAPHDFGKGGALAAVLPSASADETRPNVNAVLFRGVELLATDGHALARRSLARGQVPGGEDMLVPRDAARMLLRLCAMLPPERLTARRAGGYVAFEAESVGGAWSLTTKVVQADFPPLDRIDNEHLAGGFREVLVDVEELRALRRFERVAIFPCGGLVAWNEPGEGIAVSMHRHTDAPPATVLGVVLDDLLKRMPRGEIARLEVFGDYLDESGAGAVRFGDYIGMPIRRDGATGIPAWVRAEMADAFGLTPRALSKPRPVADLFHEVRGPFLNSEGKPLEHLVEMHLGPPTAEDRKQAGSGALQPGKTPGELAIERFHLAMAMAGQRARERADQTAAKEAARAAETAALVAKIQALLATPATAPAVPEPAAVAA